MSTAETLAAALPVIIEALAKAVVRELRSVQSAPDYDSRANLPPGASARAFRARCARIPEARQEGKVWRCPRDAWHASFPQADRTPAGPELDAYDRAARGAK